MDRVIRLSEKICHDLGCQAKDDESVLRCPASPSGRRLVNKKIVNLLARSKLRPEPVGLFPAAGPGFAGTFWILILRKDLRVRATHAVHFENVASNRKFTQPLVEPGFLRR